MRINRRSLPGFLHTLVALAFVLALQPGAMAMPAPHAANPVMAMDQMPMAAPHDRMPSHGKQGTPSKQAGPCLGMLVCYGMAMLAAGCPVFAKVSTPMRVAHFQDSVSGLTIEPDSPPPIA